MSETEPSTPSRGEETNLILIVVGAHLRAEVADRPLAYRLKARVEAWLEKHGQNLNIPLVAVVCSDVWYMNQEALHRRPTISVGGPGVNALSAYFGQKLPSVAVRDNQMVIQIDTEFVDLRVCVWGMNHDLTVDALDYFDRQYLDDYLRAVVTQVEPQEG